MEYAETILWMVGGVLILLAFAGLQRSYFPHTMVNGFMDMEKLKIICPEVFKRKEKLKK
jgi:hypothetical protein